MVTYDPAHNTEQPPFGLIVGVLTDQPGSYRIRFSNATGREIAAWLPVVVGASAQGEIRVVITYCPGPGVIQEYLTAEWKNGGASRHDGPRFVRIQCS